MITIKIMSSENLADSDGAKAFQIIVVGAGDTFTFGHALDGKPKVDVRICSNGEYNTTTYPLTGNAYVMGETGKTIATFWARTKPDLTIGREPEDLTELVRKAFEGKSQEEVKVTYDPVFNERMSGGAIQSINPQVYSNKPSVLIT